MSTNTTPTFRLSSLIRPYRWTLTWLVLVTVGLSLLSMLPPLLMRAFIDRVISNGEHSLYFPLAICMIALPVTIAVCGFLQTLGMALSGWHMLFDIRGMLYEHIMMMSMRFFGRNSTGMLVNRLMGDTSIIGNMLSSASISIIADLICAVFAVTATFTISWRLGLLLVVIIALFALNWHLNIGQLRRISRNYWQSFDRLSGGIQNRLSANLAVKTFGAENREQEVYRDQSESSLGLLENALVGGNNFWMNTILIQSVGRAAIFFLGCTLALRGDITYGDVVAFTTYAMQLLWPAIRFSEMARQIQDFRIAVDRIKEIMKEKPEIESCVDSRDIRRFQGRVDFDHVYFHYEPGRPVIDNFELHVEPGETIALIGPTGCGKSTILSLLLRFFDVSNGVVRMDGIDLREISLKTLRRQFGIVLQDPLLFNVSIAENIRYSRSDASQAEIENAARVAEIHDFIVTLKDGYRSILGSEGTQLSLGQKQRITIARAVVANPSILIMDEATSALDSESEHAIQVAMQRVLKGRTSFIVAHRLSTIKGADRIIMLERGRIIEAGNHETLMGLTDGHYRNLYEKYMNKGVIEDET